MLSLEKAIEKASSNDCPRFFDIMNFRGLFKKVGMQVGLSNAQNIPLLSKKLCRASILCFGNFIVVAEKRNLVEGICLEALPTRAWGQ